MEEMLNIYDANGKLIGIKERGRVHKDGSWHRTVQCYLFDKEGRIYFQIRCKEGKLYTTAGGHEKAGESITDAFAREIKEEVGLDLDCSNAIYVKNFTWDKKKESLGEVIEWDRADSYFYICLIDSDTRGFKFDKSEVKGIVRLDANSVLDMLLSGEGKSFGEEIVTRCGKNVLSKKEYTPYDFLNYDGGMKDNYIDVLKKVIEQLEKKSC